jgi:DNA polymerase-3 subunit gamma/tau
MSYLVLARKYRPKTFAEVVGQEVLTKTLRGAIREHRVGHAYLFCGPRGTGKTTAARIFAKALNCERGPTPDPCGACARCLAIDAGNDVDVIEIDAASNTSVDNVRDLREQVAYVPMSARFKVYIIDEVHMLSKAAFNALLKTLEEPPPHVKFLFATTEPEKLPDTIVSRCQLLRLGLFSEEEIAARLAQILAAEAIEPGEGVPAALARLARGSMRDALSITDQLLALVGSRPTLEDVQRLAGPSDLEALERLLLAVEHGDRAGVLAALGPEQGSESEVALGLLHLLRGSLHAALGQGTQLFPDFVARSAELAARAERLGPERLTAWMEELLACRERMANVDEHARLLLELCLFELCRPATTLPLAELEERLLALEQRLGAAPAAAPAPAPPPAVATVEPTATLTPVQKATRTPRPAVPVSAPKAPSAPSAMAGTPATEQARPAATKPPAPQKPSAGRAAWERFLAEIEGESAELARVLRRRGRLVAERDSEVRVRVDRPRGEERALLDAPDSRTRCERAFERALGRSVVVVWEDTAERQTGERDPFTRQVADLFGGQIEDKP